MARFLDAIDYVLVNEGAKLLDDPATDEYSKYGITAKTALSCRACTADNARAFIQGLNVQTATAFYGRHIWPSMFDGILDQKIATKLFDMAVNEGETQAVRIMQRACNQMGATIAPDGIFGYATLMAINSLNPERLMLVLCAEAIAFYAALVRQHPDKFSKYADGWKERAQKRP